MAPVSLVSSGPTADLYLPTIAPSRPIKNFSKFHDTSPGGVADSVSDF